MLDCRVCMTAQIDRNIYIVQNFDAESLCKALHVVIFQEVQTLEWKCLIVLLESKSSVF